VGDEAEQDGSLDGHAQDPLQDAEAADPHQQVIHGRRQLGITSVGPGEKCVKTRCEERRLSNTAFFVTNFDTDFFLLEGSNYKIIYC
jgi:hypothetical protein